MRVSGLLVIAFMALVAYWAINALAVLVEVMK